MLGVMIEESGRFGQHSLDGQLGVVITIGFDGQIGIQQVGQQERGGPVALFVGVGLIEGAAVVLDARGIQ